MEPDTSSGDAMTTGVCDMDLERHDDIIVLRYNPYPGFEIKRKLCTACAKVVGDKLSALMQKAANVAHANFLEWEQKERVSRQMNKRQCKLNV